MEPWRTILLLATIAGFLITVWGLVSAYLAAVRENKAASDRIATAAQLSAAEDDERKLIEEKDIEQSERSALFLQLYQRYDVLYKDNDLVRPSYDNVVDLAMYESQRLLGMLLEETRRDFLIAGIGLLVSTLASVGSLYLAGSS